MRAATSPVALEPGQQITIADIARWFPCAVRLQGNKLFATRYFRFRRAAIPPAPPKPPIVPFQG